MQASTSNVIKIPSTIDYVYKTAVIRAKKEDEKDMSMWFSELEKERNFE